ncbi:MAG: UDP-glucose--hexose-1-phosphate uridylyltransferase [Clostridia bacterium]|nr:UDP-glucose--hexose-1-phosphate uridylyltransferase [Clostridia bacterium]
MTISALIKSLVLYAEKENLISEEDEIWAVNRILEVLNLSGIDADEKAEEMPLEEILKGILDYACENGLCEDSVVYRDLFDTKIMGAITPRPSEVIGKFRSEYKTSPQKATDYYYHLSRKSDYIREYRVKNDVKWVTSTEYGDIDITINLSKPEKDPKAIAAAAKMESSSYPICLLCKENEGYSGRVNHPARQNHRIIPVKLDGDDWYLQYSPYVYYNEHCIVFDKNHVPMKISEKGFRRLFSFVEQFPHYFIGSNSDLPISGGSILTHEHFQGGNYAFAMAKAGIETELKFDGFDDIEAGIVKWPMSVIRLKGKNVDRICTLAGKILSVWREYSDSEAFIIAKTDDGVPHNTITPITRFRDGLYEIDLVLRNNITTDECPDGFYHPHPEFHNIKKENIGLIEVMGLAVLPARLKKEMQILKETILNNGDITSNEEIKKHASWAERFITNHNVTDENCDEIIRTAIGETFARILEQCGVFERNELGKKQFLRFVDVVNGK